MTDICTDNGRIPSHQHHCRECVECCNYQSGCSIARRYISLRRGHGQSVTAGSRGNQSLCAFICKQHRDKPLKEVYSIGIRCRVLFVTMDLRTFSVHDGLKWRNQHGGAVHTHPGKSRAISLKHCGQFICFGRFIQCRLSGWRNVILAVESHYNFLIL